MSKSDLEQVELVADLTRFCTGYQTLILFLLVSGYSQAEVSRLLGISRQAVNYELIQILESYRAGQRLTYREAISRRINHHE